MNVLAIGDVVGSGGCDFVRAKLPAFKRYKHVDLCVINGENSAQGNGITKDSALHLFDSGADVITTGNHVFRRDEIHDVLDGSVLPVLRPANYPDAAPGRGFTVLQRGRLRIAVMNLMGIAFMEPLRDPFDTADELLRQTADCTVRLLDLHAEATGEKRALGFYLDGRISALFGTHTHVRTADAQVLPKGTGYITDLGMTGPKQSVLGITPELVIRKMRTKLPVRFANPGGACVMDCCLFDIDEQTGLCRQAEGITIE